MMTAPRPQEVNLISAVSHSTNPPIVSLSADRCFPASSATFNSLKSSQPKVSRSQYAKQTQFPKNKQHNPREKVEVQARYNNNNNNYNGA